MSEDGIMKSAILLMSLGEEEAVEIAALRGFDVLEDLVGDIAEHVQDNLGCGARVSVARRRPSFARR